MDPQQFEEVSYEIETLHKSIKNVMEIVFAISPLLAISSHGWTKSCHSTYLLRVSDISVYYLLVINYEQDLCCAWKRPTSNPGPA
jgi:hypothetical protein